MLNKMIKLGLKLLKLSIVFLFVSNSYATLGIDDLSYTGGDKIYHYVTDDMLKNADKDPHDWLHYGRDYEGTRYSPLAQINKNNISDLVPKWNLSLGVLGAQDSQVVAVRGRLFDTTSHNKLYALDGKTGKIARNNAPYDFASKLNSILIKEKISKMSLNVNDFKKNFSWKIFASKLIDFLK